MRLRSGNETELIPDAFGVGKEVNVSHKRRHGRERMVTWKSRSICDSMIVYTRKNAQSRGQWLLKRGPAQPMFLTWALKKRRTRRQAKFIESCCYMPSTFARTSTRLSTSTDPCMLSSQIGIQKSVNERTTVRADVMGSPNASPQPHTTKRKLDCFKGLAPFNLYHAVDSLYKTPEQISWVGKNGTNAWWDQKPELIQYSEKVGGDQHPLTEFSHKEQLFESNSDCSKKLPDIVDNNVDSDLLNNGFVPNNAIQTPYVDNSYREKSQALVSLRNGQASALPVQRAESLCFCENIGDDRHLVVDVSPVARPFELNNDRCKTADRYINDNVDSASTNKAIFPVCNSGSTVKHNEPEPKRLANISEPLSSPTLKIDNQNELLIANMVSNLCIHEDVELLKGEQTNLTSLEISSVAESPSLGGKDVFEEKTLDLQPKDSLLATVKENHDRGICIKKPPSRKPKRKKHQAKVIKETTFVIKSCLNRNSRSSQHQSKKRTNKKEASRNFQLRKSSLSESVMNSNCATYVDILGSSELSRSETAACWNGIAMDNEYNKSESIQFAEQQKLVLETCRKIVRSLDEDFSRIRNSVSFGNTKKAKIKDLARQKMHTISKTYVENEENGSVLTSQIASSTMNIKGKRSSRKRQCLPKKRPHDQGCRMVSQNTLENSQSSRCLLQYGMPIMGELDVIEERLRNLSLTEEHAYSIIDRQERIPLEWKDDLIPSPESLYMAPQEIIPLERVDDLIPSTESLALMSQETLPFERRDELVPIAESLSLIPYEGVFNPLMIKKFRPKVELDVETNRVWNLLMSNGTIEDDEGDQKELWKQERQRFENLAEYFIACMRAVQGNRQFTPWKGSVLDSVIGAFLTQNVSDNLSSSAFISLASRFPPVDVNQYDTPDVQRAEDVVLDTSYCVSCKVDGQSQEMLRTKEDTRESYESKLSLEERISSQSKNSTVDHMYEGPWSHSPTSDIFSRADSNNASAESFPNHSFSHYFEFDTNAKADIKPVDLPFCHFRSCSESNLTAKVQVNERTLRNCCSEHPEETQREVSLNLHEVDRNFESSDSDGTLDVDEHLQDSEGSTSKSKMSKPMMMNGPFYRHSVSLDSIGQECNVFGECHNSSQALSYDFFERSSEEMCKSCSASCCHCSSLTEESQFAASALCSLSQEGNSVSVPKITILPDTPEELNFELSQSSTPEDTPLTNNWGPVIPKRHRTTKNVRYVKHTISQATGIDKSAMEIKLAGVKKRLDWESISKTAKEFYGCGVKKERHPDAEDAVNWDAVRCADVGDIADAIKERGMNFVLAKRIKIILERIHEDHGCIDLEWLKDIPPNDAKNFLLSIHGLGLKSVECIRLLTLQRVAFPVDTNVGRIVVRLGWVPLEALPGNIPFHIIQKYPPSNSIQKYLWPRLCTLDHQTLYELHYQMITFGKVFCTKNRPNCNACPLKTSCKHFASAYASEHLSLPAPTEKSLSMPFSSYYLPPQHNSYAVDNPLLLPSVSSFNPDSLENPFTLINTLNLLFTERQNALPDLTSISEQISAVTQNYEPIIEEPASPEHMGMASSESMVELFDIEDMPTFNLNHSDNTLETYNSYENNIQSLEATGMPASSMALVPVPPEDATIPVPKLKNITRLRTEHHVYEIPDDHQLLSELEPRLPDDPCSYLLAIWSPEKCCDSNGSQCEQESCSSCANTEGINHDTVKGTLLIPCRTTMRGRFPLNGTYFQVNEVFADHETSLRPLEVPRDWIWRFHRRKVYFGTSIPSISRGLTYEEIQECFMRGYVCVRAFDRKVRAPRPLIPRLHFVSSRKDA